jgi:hypothetical protein
VSLRPLAGLMGILALSCSGSSAALPPEPPPDPDVIAVVLERNVTLKERERLSGIVLGVLLDKFAGDHHLKPTDAEVDEFVEGMQAVQKERGDLPESEQKALREVGRSFVQRWKVNQALFGKYGGRVIFQQAGPEPLDAHHDFLKEREKDGAFRILKPQYEADLWKYFSSAHSFYPADKGAEALRTPWWKMKPPK